MSVTAVVALNVVLDVGIVALLAYVMRTPYRLGRRPRVDAVPPAALPSTERLAA